MNFVGPNQQESSNIFMNPDKLFIRSSGTATQSCKAERAVMTIKISSETSSKDQSFENITKTSNVLQHLAQRLRVEPEGSDAAATGGPLRAPLTEWHMGRLTTQSYIPHEVAQRVQSRSNPSLFRNPQPGGQQRPDDPSAQPLTAEEAEPYRKYNAKTDISMKFQDFSVLSSVASEVARTQFAELTNINWYLLDHTRLALEKEVRKLSVKDAVEKANDFAEAALGTRTAKMTYVESAAASVSGASSAFGNQMMSQQMQVKKQARSSDGASDPPKEEINLEPEKIVVVINVWGQFVA